MAVPYKKGLSDSFKNMFSKIGVKVYFKEGKSIKNLLVTPSDRDNITEKQSSLQVQVWQVGVWWVHRGIWKDL